MAHHFFKEHFFGQGGFPGQHEEPEEIENKKLYEILGVEQNTSQEEIRKAFKKMAIKHHPDRGGDSEKFKEVNAANEVLSNPEKREVYDKYGLEGLRNFGEQSGSGGLNNIFEMFFGEQGRGGRQSRQQKPQMKPTVKEAKINLHQAFHGCMIEVKVDRSKVCEVCTGKGGSKVDICQQCKGKGIVMKMIQLGPGMYSQSQSNCDKCGGKGKIIEKQSLCKPCNGKGIEQICEKIEVPVEPGFPNQDKIVIEGKGNEHPEYRTGELIVVISVEPHKVFQRLGNDLVIQKKISLIEALKGFKFNIDHINDHSILIETPKDKIIKHQEKMKISNLGMHHYKDSLSNGDLFIIFEVEFPKKINPEQILLLEQALPKGILPLAKVSKNVYSLENVS